ncbi:MAG: hypothetical protein KIT86_04505 [Hydrogenophaga sp.]|uniref:hypothetical protein n=1 Tax=Hydrogenophaga sp. TaxID=1904254 RepID=UPI0026320349|nr:hypothetical protein [Hydrogenophaga sp.]MCW5668899.1 hypothetical protein [Hydrogenophaga sp.]
MQCLFRPRLGELLVIAGMIFGPCSLALAQTLAQSEGFDPLALESAPVEKVESSGSLKMFLEGSIGTSSRRYGQGYQDMQRASFDILYSGNLSPGLRAVLSNRTDVIHPAALGNEVTVNTLREAYLSWQPEGGNTVFDFGRINQRSGPGYGYNPTDFFRDGSLRVITSADPFALRQNRMGTVMLRGQRLWEGGSLSLALSPKLATRPGADGWSLDLGSTNNRDRGLLTLGTKISESINTQLLVYKETGLSPTVGVNMTALLSDAATAHMEWTRGKEPDLLSRALTVPSNTVTRNRFVAGATYTTLGKTSITAEYQYNGFALGKTAFANLANMPGAQQAYLQEGLRRQEIASRQAIILYLTQQELFVKDLELTAYIRINSDDESKLAWLELRHHWPSFDLAFQYQRTIGKSNSEFGLLPDRRVLQILGTYYF